MRIIGTAIIFALITSTAACTAPTSDDDETNSATRSDGTCAAPEGSYLIQMSERANGTCGDLPEVIVTVGGEASGGSGGASDCEYHSTWSENGCRLMLDYTCETSPGVLYTQKGTLTWNASGSRATGIVNVSLRGDLSCFSAYNATWIRQ